MWLLVAIGKYKRSYGVIVFGDLIAHSQVWGSRATDKRGEALLEMAESLSLVVINDGIVLTFPCGNSYLDLTLTTSNLSVLGPILWNIMYDSEEYTRHIKLDYHSICK